jgi:hypothetical protein
LCRCETTGQDAPAPFHFEVARLYSPRQPDGGDGCHRLTRTFMDNGYYDMWKIMRALRDVSFDGIVILDHSPAMVGGNYTQTAYGFAYMKALLNRANAEASHGRHG